MHILCSLCLVAVHFLIRGSRKKSVEMHLGRYAWNEFWDMLNACIVCVLFSYCSLFLPQEFKGYVFKIMGGCDKQGFPMKQGVLTPGRVRLLLHRGWIFYILHAHP